MKKIFWLATGLAVAISFMGVQIVRSRFQTVPVTVAHSNVVEVTASTAPEALSAPNTLAITAVPTATAFPTLAPIVTKQPLPAEPAATAIASEAITKPRPRTGEQALLDRFIQTVSGKAANVVSGVYVPGRFSVPVVQQPAGEPSFVSTEDQTATQFGSADAYGTIGLLAHNYLSGQKFFNLQAGDEVVIVYGSGEQELYRVTRMERYQALSPTSVYSEFINLSDPNQTKYSANQVFQQVYAAEDQVVFQTCIDANGDPSWGRLFVIAEKVNP